MYETETEKSTILVCYKIMLRPILFVKEGLRCFAIRNYRLLSLLYQSNVKALRMIV